MTRRRITALTIVGAACYAAWDCLHLLAAYNVYLVGVPLEPSMVKGRVFQDAWNLLFFGATAISVALTLNIRNSRWGYWINLWVTSLADSGLIFFVLIPGYWSWWPGLAGPVLWGLGFTFTTLAYVREKLVRCGTRSYTQEQIDDSKNSPDWFPHMHPPMPSVVAQGTATFACGSCHLPTGTGHDESAYLASIPAPYIVNQTAKL